MFVFHLPETQKVIITGVDSLNEKRKKFVKMFVFLRLLAILHFQFRDSSFNVLENQHRCSFIIYQKLIISIETWIVEWKNGRNQFNVQSLKCLFFSFLAISHFQFLISRFFIHCFRNSTRMFVFHLPESDDGRNQFNVQSLKCLFCSFVSQQSQRWIHCDIITPKCRHGLVQCFFRGQNDRHLSLKLKSNNKEKKTIVNIFVSNPPSLIWAMKKPTIN
jgi:hypothetical protein